jgi:hypothetical protein
MEKKLELVILGLILAISPASVGFATAIDTKELCLVWLECDKCGTVEEECDDCTGTGYIEWTKTYINCSGSTVTDGDCDDCKWEIPTGYNWCEVPDSPFQQTLDSDFDVDANGAEGCPGDCDSTGTYVSCHWDVTIHREYDADTLTAWTDDLTIKECRSTPITMQNQGDVITYTAGSSTTTTTGGDCSFTTGVKADAVEAEVGAGYSYSASQSKSFSGSISHTVSSSDEGKKIGGFIEQVRRKTKIKLRRWGCNGEITADAETGWARKVLDPSPNYYTGTTSSDVYDNEQNTSVLSGGTVSQSTS